MPLPDGETHVVYFDVTNYRYYSNRDGLTCSIHPTSQAVDIVGRVQ
jgi:hypothetical protein